jgi:tetratricopeptide (TPR) repeat protein
MNIKLSIFILVASVGSLFNSCGNTHKQPEAAPADSLAMKQPEELKQLNAQLKADPRNAELYHKRALYYYSAGKFSQGLADMLIAVNTDSTKSAYFVTLSDLYFVDNQTSKTKAALEKALQLDDKNVEALLKLAELYLYVQNFELSIKYINLALKQDKYNAKAYFMKGMNYKELGDTARAISSMQTAVEQDQMYYHAYIQLGILCAAKKNPLAVEYFKNALRIRPKSSEALYSLGKYYQDQEELENAMKTYTELVGIEDKNINAYYNMGVIQLINLKKYNEAINYFSTAIKIAPKYVNAYYARGLSYQALGNIKMAVADFQACTSINPKFEPAHAALKQLGKNK